MQMCIRWTFLASLLLVLVTNPVIARDLWCDALAGTNEATAARIDMLASRVVSDSVFAVPKVRTEGLMPGQGLHDVSQKAKEDFPKILALAYGWRTQGHKPYLDASRRFITLWATTYIPTMNPIDETEFTQLFEGYSIIRSYLPAQDVKLVDEWLRRFYDGYLTDMRHPATVSRGQISNWQSHRIKIVVSAAVAMGKYELLPPLESFFNIQVKYNIRADGSTEDFHKRDALSYATYSLLPLVETALVARSAGAGWIDQNSEARTRLISALDWMVPYAMGHKTHIEYRNSSVKFDHMRSESGVKGHEKVAWKPVNARDLFWRAAYMDAKYIGVARAIEPRPSAYLAACRGIHPGK